MQHTPQSQSIIEAFDQLVLAIPEIRDLRAGYGALAGNTPTERSAWLRENAPGSVIDELRAACHLAESDSPEDDSAYLLLEALVASGGGADSPGVLQQLLTPPLIRQEFANGAPYLLAVIHQFTDLEELFEQIRRAHQQTFDSVGVRPETIDEIAFVLPFFADKVPMTEIAWELVYREHPHARTFDEAQRKAEFDDLHRKQYSRVRWLKSHAVERVSELLPVDSQDSE